MKQSMKVVAFAALLALSLAVPVGCADNSDTDVPIEVSTAETSIDTIRNDTADTDEENSRALKIAVTEDQSRDKKTSAESNGSNDDAVNITAENTAGTEASLTDTEVSKEASSEPSAVQESTEPVTVDAVSQNSSSVPETSEISEVYKVPVEADSIALSVHTLAMNAGDTVQLTAAIYPAETDSTRIRWYWSDSSVIVIDEKARVTAVGPGTATITAETINGKKDECRVTVYGSGTISPVESSNQTKALDPAYLPYYPDYDLDAVIADLRKVGEEQYGLVWDENLWVRNKGTELGGPTGACTIEYPARSAKACYADYDGKPVYDSASFREDCLRMFKDLEKDFSGSSWTLNGRPFKIMAEDVGLDERGVHDYWIYLLYN